MAYDFTRDELIEALIYELMEEEDDEEAMERKAKRKAKFKKWGKRAAAVGAGLGAAAAGGYVYKNRKSLGAKYQAAREVGSLAGKRAKQASHMSNKEAWEHGKKTGAAAGRLLRMKFKKIDKAMKK